MSWISYFNNTKWTALSGSWNGSLWDSGIGDQLVLDAIAASAGGIPSGYRPNLTRITHTGSNITFYLRDTVLSVIASASSYPSSGSVSINFGSNDIQRLTVSDSVSAFTVDDIEFSSSSSSTSSSSQSSSSTSTTERIHFWHYVLNEGGQPIQDAEIRLYLQSSPTTEAEIYVTESAGSATTCSQAEIKTDNDGYFEFWLEGETGTGGYSHSTEFILEWFKAGTAPGYIYNYNPWPNALVWRDTNIGADRDNQNKFVSNYLANKWYQEHIVDGIVPSAAPHNLYALDYQSGCDDNTYNKVLSNKFIYDVQVGCNAGDTFNLTSIYADVQEHQELVNTGNPWTASGDFYVKDITHSNVVGDTVVRMVELSGADGGYNEIVPALVQRLAPTQTRVAIDDNIEAYVTIQGGAAPSSSSSSQSSSSLSSSSSSLSNSVTPE